MSLTIPINRQVMRKCKETSDDNSDSSSSGEDENDEAAQVCEIELHLNYLVLKRNSLYLINLIGAQKRRSKLRISHSQDRRCV